jgi:hypothetical protein
MHRFTHAVLSLLLSLMVASFASAQGMSAEVKAWCARAVPALKKALEVHPTKGAQKAADSGDFRYLEWFGFASAVPGVKSQACVKENGLSKPFEGTSDALCSDEHRALYERSYAHAEAFNRQMSVERKKRGLRSCDDA